MRHILTRVLWRCDGCGSTETVESGRADKMPRDWERTQVGEHAADLCATCQVKLIEARHVQSGVRMANYVAAPDPAGVEVPA